MGKKNKIKKYKVKYAGSRGKGIVVSLPFNPRKGVCEACGKSVAKGEIKLTALHHWWYAYRVKTVRENPLLALENTSELCYGCHEVADAIRALLYAKPERVVKVARLLRGDQRKRFERVLKEVIEELRKTQPPISPIIKKMLEAMENAEKKKK